MKTGIQGLGIALTALVLVACGGGGGGGVSEVAPPTCTMNDIAGEPDILGQPTVYANAVSPGDTLTMSIPVDADTRLIYATLQNGSLTSPGSIVALTGLSIATLSNQTVTLNIPLPTAVATGNYSIALSLSATVAPVLTDRTIYNINLNGDNNVSRQFTTRTAVSAPTTTCIKAARVAVAPGNTPSLVGELDPTFNGTGVVKVDLGANERVLGTVVQPDGKIIALGDDDTDLLLIRLNIDGSMDNSFGINGISRLHISNGNDHAGDLVLDNHGRIVLTGYGKFPTQFQSFVTRLLANGTIDRSFGVNGVALAAQTGTFAHAIAIDNQEAIVIGGSAIVFSSASESNMFVQRFTATGTVDTTFNGTGYKIRDVNYPNANASDEEIFRIAIDRENNIIFSGAANISPVLATADILMGRFFADGSSDYNFNYTGPARTCTDAGSCGYIIDSLGGLSAVFGLNIDTDNQVVAAGVYNSKILVGKFDAAGIRDATFASSLTPISGLDMGADILSLPDGKVLAGGNTHSPWGGLGVNRSVLPYSGDFALLRFTADGSHDSSFGAGTGVLVSDVTGQPEQLVRMARRGGDGMVIAVGNTTNGSNSDILITRYR